MSGQREGNTCYLYYSISNRRTFKSNNLALERKKWEEGKRKRYEERMQRKAKREGKSLDYYIKEGLDPPLTTDIERIKSCDCEDKSLELWKSIGKYKQHCFMFHYHGSCPRDRSCCFLHMDAVNNSDSSSNGNNSSYSNEMDVMG